jgi:hypothetical protein
MMLSSLHFANCNHVVQTHRHQIYLLSIFNTFVPIHFIQPLDFYFLYYTIIWAFLKDSYCVFTQPQQLYEARPTVGLSNYTKFKRLSELRIRLVHFDAGAINAQLLHVSINIENFEHLFKAAFSGPFVESVIYCLP